MKLYTYLNYGGNCRQAFEFYVEHLGGKITEISTHGELPGATNVPQDWKNAVAHARLELGETMLLGAEIPPDRFQPMRSAYLTLMVNSVDEAGTDLRPPQGGRADLHAHGGNVLCAAVRHAQGSVRDIVDLLHEHGSEAPGR